jgi:hypothetical protein
LISLSEQNSKINGKENKLLRCNPDCKCEITFLGTSIFVISH